MPAPIVLLAIGVGTAAIIKMAFGKKEPKDDATIVRENVRDDGGSGGGSKPRTNVQKLGGRITRLEKDNAYMKGRLDAVPPNNEGIHKLRNHRSSDDLSSEPVSSVEDASETERELDDGEETSEEVVSQDASKN